MGEMSGMVEGALLMLLFVVLTGVVIANLNDTYSQSYSIGLDTSAINDFSSAFQTSYESTTGEVETTSEGLTLTSGWKMAKSIFAVTWSFMNGSWIPAIINGMLDLDGDAGTTIAIILRVLFVSILIFTIIKLFFKITP